MLLNQFILERIQFVLGETQAYSDWTALFEGDSIPSSTTADTTFSIQKSQVDMRGNFIIDSLDFSTPDHLSFKERVKDDDCDLVSVPSIPLLSDFDFSDTIEVSKKTPLVVPLLALSQPIIHDSPDIILGGSQP